MKHLSMIKVLGIGVCICGAFFAACSSGSSSGGDNGGGSGSSSGGGSGSGGVNPNCTGLQVVFAPSYSAYESSHTYQIPFTVLNGDMTQITWSVDNGSMLQLAPATDSQGTALEMATIAASGSATITAKDNSGNCGQSVLTITGAQSGDWDIGNQRYNNGVVLHRPDGGFSHDAGGLFDGGGGGGGGGFDASTFSDLACTNCHGPNSNPSAPWKDVSHTPEQIGGFSDDELITIFTMGQIPDGGYFDPSVICPAQRPCSPDQAYKIWSGVHQWDMTDEEKHGIVIYLRSLTPEAQTGSSNFGGHCDGGYCGHGDGGHHHDGGGFGDSGGGNDSGGGGSDSGGGGSDATTD